MQTSVFVIAPIGCGIAATTRPNQLGRIGLPGGKKDQCESLRAAAIREAAEEGFALHGLHAHPFHAARVEGNMVFWFRAQSAEFLPSFKEQGRITPVAATVAAIRNSGYGNDEAIDAYCCGSGQYGGHDWRPVIDNQYFRDLHVCKSCGKEG